MDSFIYLAIPRDVGRWELGNDVPKNFPPPILIKLRGVMLYFVVVEYFLVLHGKILYTLELFGTPRFSGLAL